MEQVDCIITAAGLSSRMGQWKMMLPWREGTILDASIKNALQFCSRIILVTGFRAEVLQSRYAENTQITIVHNPDYRSGLFSSVLAGSRVVGTEYCFITHGDLPCLNHDIFNEIWKLRNNGIILPQFNGTPGHPILVTQNSLRQAVSLQQITSVRQALLRGEHCCPELSHPEIIFDIDTPADFIKLHSR